MYKRSCFVVLFSVLCLYSSDQALGQGYPPAEAASRMTVAAGLKVSLFASEPMVRQPVAIEFDDRGRLWVIQYLQYPNPAGLKRVAVDRYSRTTYDRLSSPTSLALAVQFLLRCGHSPTAPIVGVGKPQIRRMLCTGFG